MAEDITTTPNALAGGQGVSSPDGNGAGDSGGNPDATQQQETIKDILSKTLGKEFKDDESALKAVKDTFSFVGKKKEDFLKEVQDNLGGEDLKNQVTSLQKQVEESNFYSEHPELKPYKDIISKMSDSPRKVMEDGSLKELLDKAIEHDKAQNSKSVLESNSRIGGVSDKSEKLKDYAKSGDFSQKELAVDMVREAFNI